jgi:hypothetical protein
MTGGTLDESADCGNANWSRLVDNTLHHDDAEYLVGSISSLWERSASRMRPETFTVFTIYNKKPIRGAFKDSETLKMRRDLLHDVVTPKRPSSQFLSGNKQDPRGESNEPVQSKP